MIQAIAAIASIHLPSLLISFFCWWDTNTQPLHWRSDYFKMRKLGLLIRPFYSQLHLLPLSWLFQLIFLLLLKTLMLLNVVLCGVFSLVSEPSDHPIPPSSPKGILFYKNPAFLFPFVSGFVRCWWWWFSVYSIRWIWTWICGFCLWTCYQL